jgi:enterochelin esterase-like enzyme
MPYQQRGETPMPNWTTFEAFLKEAQATPTDQRQTLVDTLLRERLYWPWVNDNMVTFIYSAPNTVRVALNLDTIKSDPPFAPLERLEGTSLFYVTRQFERDDLLDYLLAVNDPMTPLAQERDIVRRIERFWHTDPRNPAKITSGQADVSVVRLDHARPFPDWSKLNRVPRGKIHNHTISSKQLGFDDRQLWVYTPPDYDETFDKEYPMLILQDGQWMFGALQIPQMADALIKHGVLEPLIIVSKHSGNQQDRIKNYVSNDKHYNYLMLELLPFMQANYRVDATNLGIGGVSAGGIAAAHAALKNPAVFERIIMISPPLGKGIAQDELRKYKDRFEKAKKLPERIFHAVGRYESRSRFLLPSQVLNAVLSQRDDVAYHYTEIGSGHGLVAFRSVFPEALQWAFPGKVGV